MYLGVLFLLSVKWIDKVAHLMQLLLLLSFAG